MLTVSCVWGLGNHIDLLYGSQLVKTLEWSWFGQIVAVQAIGFGKIAVIAFLLRIQDRAQSRKNTILVWFLYFIGFSNVVINLDQMILILLQCSPVPKLWNPAIPGTCNHIQRTNNVAYFQGSWAALSDVLLAIYPIFVFWSLKISNKIKIGLCLLMAGGFIAAASGVVKTVNLKLISVEHDITYHISTLCIWAYTECWLVLILGSLPPLRPLFVCVFQQLSTTASRSRNKSSGYYPQLGNINIPMYPPASSANKRANTLSGDTDSERRILPPNAMAAEDGILRTTHVHVASSPKGEGDDSDDSLNGINRGIAY
ncbi:MAG: hypothetical protein Q9217_000943 [Psora testacea]